MSWNAQVWVKWKDDYKNGSWEWLQEFPEVSRAWSTMGDWDCCLEVNTQDPAGLEEFVWKKLRDHEGVGQTSSTWTKEVWAR